MTRSVQTCSDYPRRMALHSISWNLIRLAMAGSLIIAILAGILPVRRVMRDNVVEAIRAEE